MVSMYPHHRGRTHSDTNYVRERDAMVRYAHLIIMLGDRGSYGCEQHSQSRYTAATISQSETAAYWWHVQCTRPVI